MTSILTVVGARPQFVKAAVVSRLLAGKFSGRATEFLLHTGQHFDDGMSGVFFRELGIPEPDLNLGVHGGPHGEMTGRMLTGLEPVLAERRPDLHLVYGDTNSTLAGALAAAKLGIPVAHVEAGLRSFDRRMPEEINRVLADHLSSLLFCPTPAAVANLAREGITAGVHLVGDVMLDAALFYREKALALPPRPGLPADFCLVTVHRQENTDDPARLRAIIEALNAFSDLPAVFPVHPRTAARLRELGLETAAHVVTIPPVGYLEMVALENRARFIVTDSGGVQKEAYFFRRPCITLRENTEWTETVSAGANTLAGPGAESILRALRACRAPGEWPPLYGDGAAAEKILSVILAGRFGGTVP